MRYRSSSRSVNLPPGFRFHPSDEELVTYYLANKILDPLRFASPAIADVDLNKSEPWELPGKNSSIHPRLPSPHTMLLSFSSPRTTSRVLTLITSKYVGRRMHRLSMIALFLMINVMRMEVEI
jgi:hypothetical protein